MVDAACTLVMYRAEGGGLPVLLVPLTKPVQPARAKLHAARKIAAIDGRLRPAHFDECVTLVFTFFPNARSSRREGGRTKYPTH